MGSFVYHSSKSFANGLMALSSVKKEEASSEDSAAPRVRPNLILGGNGFPAVVGAVRFRGSRRRMARWARVAKDTSPSSLLTLLTKNWGMEHPGVLISVIGHGNPDSFDKSIGDTEIAAIRQGLQSVSQKTRAWILTDGERAGASRVIGRALQSTEGIRCIGFLDWTSVEGRAHLFATKSKTTVYTSATVRESAQHHDDDDEAVSGTHHGPKVSLEPNHTCFILSDDDERQAVPVPTRATASTLTPTRTRTRTRTPSPAPLPSPKPDRDSRWKAPTCAGASNSSRENMTSLERTNRVRPASPSLSTATCARCGLSMRRWCRIRPSS